MEPTDDTYSDVTSKDRLLNGTIMVVGFIVLWLGIFLWCREMSDVAPVPSDAVEESSR